jgi:hypothetical protein
MMPGAPRVIRQMPPVNSLGQACRRPRESPARESPAREPPAREPPAREPPAREPPARESLARRLQLLVPADQAAGVGDGVRRLDIGIQQRAGRPGGRLAG